MTLDRLWIVLFCVGLCGPLHGGQEVSRRIPLRNGYLVIPIENKADPCPMTISLGDELIACASVELARDKVDFWTFVDLRQYAGQTVTLSAESPPRGFHAIHSSHCIPGAENLYRETYRPQFHFCSRRGWHNDSNGLVYYTGQYHLFYQHSPYGVRWGNMTWGHAVSRDLVHWSEMACTGSISKVATCRLLQGKQNGVSPSPTVRRDRFTSIPGTRFSIPAIPCVSGRIAKAWRHWSI